MKKKIIKIFIWAFISLVLIIIIFASVLYFNKDKVQKLIVGGINSSLSTPVNVGEIDISLRKFPSASLVFRDIYTRGINSKEGDTLLFAEQVFFQFDVWQAITSNISIKKISIENALLDLKYFKNGNNNFRIWKSKNNSEDQIFTLEEINLNRVNIRFFNEVNNLSLSALTSNSTLNGDFNTQLISINSKCNFNINHITFPNKTSLKNFDTRFSFSFIQNEALSHFNSGSLTLAGMPFTFQGIVESKNTLFSAKSEEIDLSTLQNFLENQQLLSVENLDFGGQASAELSWGDIGSAKPGLKVGFNINKGKLSNQENLDIQKILCNGSYTFKNGVDEAKIQNFRGKGETGSITGSASVKNFSKPLLTLKLKSDLNFSEWVDILLLDTIEAVKGELNLELDFKNQFRSFHEIVKSDLRNAQVKGSLNMEDIEFSFKNSSNRVKAMNGELMFSDSKAIVNRLFFQIGQSDIFLEGRFLNLLPFAIVENQKLHIDCRLKSQNLKIEDFLMGGDNSPESYSLNFGKALDLSVLMELDKFSMKRFRASEIKTKLQIKNEKITVSNLEMNSDQGHYKGSLAIHTSDTNPYDLNAQLSFNGLNINHLFNSFENFGQNAIVAKNIYGTLSGSGELKAKMTPDLILDKSSILLESAIEISNGGIKDYEPMTALSRFSDIEELKNVRFNSLKNNISIRNSVVSIPNMRVNSNVLDLEVKGTHNFENIVDYRLKLKAEDALFKKRKKKKKLSEFDEHLVQRSKDEPYIYVKMYGPIDELKIELDQKSIGQSISDDLKDQGNQLKNIFKKDKPDKKSDNPGIIYDWEEEDDG